MITRLDIALAINKAASVYEEWAATAAYAGKTESAELTAEQARLMRTGADYIMEENEMHKQNESWPHIALTWRLAAYSQVICGDETTSEDQVAIAESTEIARRIVACWNACRIIPTDAIEGGLFEVKRPSDD